MTDFSGWFPYANFTLAVTTSSARIQLPDTTIQNVDLTHFRSETRRQRQARIVVPAGTLTVATDLVAVTFGDITVVATAANGIVIPVNWVEVLEVPLEATHMAAIAVSAAGASIAYVGIGRQT